MSLNNNKIAIVFPGQGSQRLGMAADFVEAFPESRQIFEQSSDILKFDMFKLCFEEQDRLNQTEYMQPAILTAEIAMLRAFNKVFGRSPDCFAGHSMGEYTAMVAAEVFNFEDGLKLVNGRSSLMQSSVTEGSGAMVALIMAGLNDAEFADTLLEHKVEVANRNSASQLVLAGMKADIEKVSAALQASYPEMRIVDLGIGLPFHSSKMNSSEPDLLKYISSFLPKMNLANGSKVMSNLTGFFHTPETLVDNLTKQISGCVEWRKNMQLLGEVASHIIELGPNKVLGRFFKEAGINIQSVYSVKSLHRVLL